MLILFGLEVRPSHVYRTLFVMRNVDHDLRRQRKAVAAHEIEAELEEFQALQSLVNGYLKRNTSSEARQWYVLYARVPSIGGHITIMIGFFSSVE